MKANAFDLCHSQIVSSPCDFHEIMDKPGVYRLQNKCDWSAVMVAMRDGRYLYVNGRVVVNFLEVMVPAKCTFWPTACDVPDEIII
jgi:hypothetical protein